MDRIYLDNAATTRIDDEVFVDMLPYLRDTYGNASSQHWYGREATKAVDQARRTIAEVLKCVASEVFFTSGGTESDNWAIRGVAEVYAHKGNHIITSAIEHPAVLNTLKYLERRGYDVTYLPVDSQGFISIKDLEDAITDKTILITIMFANNEIGTIQPMADIVRVAHEHDILVHTDAVQAMGSVNVNLKDYPVDLMSISGHKIYGPKGIGILYKSNRVKLGKFMIGGEQERGMRAGTLNTAGIVGIASAMSQIGGVYFRNKIRNLARMRMAFIKEVQNKIPFVHLNGPQDDIDGVVRLAGNANFSFEFIEGEALLLRLDLEGISVSSGSACSSGSLEPSHVLLACGVDIALAHGSIRFSFGKYNTREEMKIVVDKLAKIVEQLRELSPLFNQAKGEGSYV